MSNISPNPQDVNTQVNITETALWYASGKWAVFPLVPDSKIPLTSNGYKDATTDPAIIAGWWQHSPDANIGLACGMSGLIALDGDPLHYTDESRAFLADLQANHPTAAQESPTGGIHLIYKLPADVSLDNSSRNLPPGIDVRVNGYIALAPSEVTYRGKDAVKKNVADGYHGRYSWQAGKEPHKCPPKPLPQHVIDLLTPAPQQPRAQAQQAAHAVGGDIPHVYKVAIERELNELATCPVGRRSKQVFKTAARLGEFVALGYITESDVERDVLDAASQCGILQFDGEAETRRAIHRGMAKGKSDPKPIDPKTPDLGGTVQMAQDAADKTKGDAAHRGTPYTNGNGPAAAQQSAATTPNLLRFDASDLGNAYAVEALYPGQFAYNSAYGWMAWTGTHWDAESSAEARVIQAINATLAERVRQAAASGNMPAYSRLITFCSANKGRVQGAAFQLQYLPSVAIDVAEFDAQPDLLNTLSGVIDLRTKKIYPHDPAQRFTYCVPLLYAPGVDYSEWLALIAKWLPSDQLETLRLMGGYSATGHTREEVLVYLFGPSRSGKGTLTETLRAVLGEKMTRELQFSTFTEQRSGDSQNFDLAPLKPCRVIFASESNEYERFNEAKVKALTGGNEIYCSFKHKGHFNYKPKFKIWLSSNHAVNADPDDDAVWGRIRIFHFPNSFLGKEDKSLKSYWLQPDKLMQVLAWLIDGAYDWYQLGPGGIQETTTGAMLKQQTRESLDQLGQWLDESCEVGQSYSEPNSALYGNYETWCKSNGVTPKKQKAFSTAMNKRGYLNPHTKAGKKWLGLRLVYTSTANPKP